MYSVISYQYSYNMFIVSVFKSVICACAEILCCLRGDVRVDGGFEL